MTPERWQQVDQLFHAALDVAPEQRKVFLTAQCSGDDSLRREVESLISSFEESDSFIETPPSDIAADLFAVQEPAPEPGQQIENYLIVRKLGSGGMGEVYLAEDTRLKRKVALKLLPAHFTINPDRVRRFEREARAASALNHPNIVTIYEIGQSNSIHFIVTEFVDGKTLRELIDEKPLTLNETLNVSIQVADALSGAHNAGIVHRDIKPENIMIRADGYVKVLDFGLAKLTEQQDTEPDLETPTLLQSNPGLIMGTVQYMSPEQARGRVVDARSDIWSVGIVLYELLTGHVPFSGETPSHVMVSLMETNAPALKDCATVPAELDRIVMKALHKDPKKRFRSASDLTTELKQLKQQLQLEAGLKGLLEVAPDRKTTRAVARATGNAPFVTQLSSSAQYLVTEVKRHRAFAAIALAALLVGTIGLSYWLMNRRGATSAVGGKKSIAVLPFKPLDSASRDQLFEMGMADSLIHRLSSMKTFFIRPLSATRKYEDLAQDPLVAGREQRVDYVIAANYQLADGKIRVTVQLFNVASGQVEETRLIEKQMDNIFATQDAIGSEVGKLLQIHFATSGLPAGVRRGTTSEEAYRFYLQGKYLAMKRNPRDAAKAVEYLDQALRLDPNFALAYAQKAHAYRKINKDSREVEIQTVKNLIAKALALDSNLAEAYAVRADSALLYEWEFPAVERDVLHAIELEPNNDMAHWVYALLLAMRGRLSEALIEIETCQAIDPGAAVYMRDRGRILYLARRYDEAIAELERGVALDEQMGIGWLRLAYAAKGDDARTYEIFIKNQKRMNPDLVAAYEQAYETAGWDGIRRKILENFKLSEKLTGAGFAMMAGVAARLGEKDLAFDYLNKAVETRDWWALHMKNDPELDPLRDDPRFNEVLRRAGLN